MANNHMKTAGEHIEFQNKADNMVDQISEEGLRAFEDLKLRRRHRYIIFKIGETAVEVEKVGDRNNSMSDFIGSLPFTDCRYGIYDQEYVTSDGRQASKLFFLSWFPLNATPYNKMAYTSAKSKFRERLPGIFDFQASSAKEVENYLRAQGNTASGDNNDDEDDSDPYFD